MNIQMIIDTREHDLDNKLRELCKYTIEQLELGDIIFRKDDETILVIERKTIDDLKSSICDGRLREQKARLSGSYPKYRIIYLIEGSLDQPLNSKVSGLPVSTLLGSLINTQLRDNIKVYKTNSINESAVFLSKLLDKLNKDGDNFFKDDTMTQEKYTAFLKKGKKANMTPATWFVSQLCLIPQVTEKVAEVIVEKYRTLHDFVLEYEKVPEDFRKKLVADLKFDIKNGKTRRIGDKISERIYNFFYGHIN